MQAAGRRIPRRTRAARADGRRRPETQAGNPALGRLRLLGHGRPRSRPRPRRRS
jgi:hypothetical protein